MQAKLSRDEYKKEEAQRNRAAQAHLDSIIAHPEDEETVFKGVRGYFQQRFFLDDEEMNADSMLSLSKKSIDKLLQKYDAKDLKDLGSKCTSESSAMTKRILFIMTISNKLQIDYDPDDWGAIDSLSDLGKVICKELNSVPSK